MRVLIVGEGAHEIPSVHERPSGDSEAKGALGVLTSRLLGGGHSYQYRQIKEGKPSRRLRGVVGGRGMTRRALHWMQLAESNNFDAVVLVVDEDGSNARVSEIHEAQKTEVSAIPRALGVAIRSFDAWMLADEQALSKVLGYPVQTQPDPESNKRPKETCQALRDDSPNDPTLRDMYEGVADSADIGVLRNRCPKGFAPFAERVESLTP